MKTVAIYPGSFNPFTVGHLNILEKAERLFDEVFVAVGQNPMKKDLHSFSLNPTLTEVIISDKHRHELLSFQLKRKVTTYSGYLTEYVKQLREEYGPNFQIVIIRGLRNGDDLDYEINQLRVMEDLLQPLDVVFINCDREYEYISSTMCRAMETVESNSSLRYIAYSKNLTK